MEKDLTALTLVGPTTNNQVKDPLAVLHLDNRLYMMKKYFFDDFQAFFIVCDYANVCPAKHLLVKIHNKYITVFSVFC